MTIGMGDLAAAHKELRDLLAETEQAVESSPERARELALALARHHRECTEQVVDACPLDDLDADLTRRLLLSATRGAGHLAQRLQAPCSGAESRERLLLALRELLMEHERFEGELVALLAERAPVRAPHVTPAVAGHA
jgi:hypothetical protein